MPNLDQQHAIALPKQIEDLTLLGEVSRRTAGISRLEMRIQGNRETFPGFRGGNL